MNGFKKCDFGHFYNEGILKCPYCNLNNQKPTEIMEVRDIYYVPNYDKLFFQLAGFYNSNENDLTEILKKYNQFDFILFPLIFDHLESDNPLFDIDNRMGLEEGKVGLYFFDVKERVDQSHELNSNTKFSYINKNQEASGSILSVLLNLPIDGENKLILVDKKDLFTLRYVAISKIEKQKPLNHSSLFELPFQEAKMEESIYSALAQYLSLHWKQLDEDVKRDISIHKVRDYDYKKNLKEEWNTVKQIYHSAMSIRNGLYDKYKKIDPSITSLFQLAELKGGVFLEITEFLDNIDENRRLFNFPSASLSDSNEKNFSLKPNSRLSLISRVFCAADDDEKESKRRFEKLRQEEEIKRIILNEDLRDLVVRFPNFTYEELSTLREQEIELQINSIIELEGLDFESLIFLKTANALYSSLNRIISDDFDYSPFVLSYSKFIEKELNLSLVQLVRKKLGVSMPEFYNKYCTKEGDFYVYVHEDFKVNFNMKDKKSGNYLAPGLGQNINALKSKVEEYNLNKEVVEELFFTGKKLNDYRNRSAHSELLNKDDLEQVRYFVSLLNYKNVFNELIKTKKDILQK